MLQRRPGSWIQKRYWGLVHAVALAVKVTVTPVAPGDWGAAVRMGGPGFCNLPSDRRAWFRALAHLAGED